jgi:hypothetical protein
MRRSRTIRLDRDTVAVLRDHRRQQAGERLAAGPARNDTSGLVFSSRWREPLHPDTVIALYGSGEPANAYGVARQVNADAARVASASPAVTGCPYAGAQVIAGDDRLDRPGQNAQIWTARVFISRQPTSQSGGSRTAAPHQH